MTPVVEKRRATIINILYFALILGLAYLILKNIVPLFFPFIFAFLVALMFNRPVTYLSKKTKLNRSFLSVVFVLLLLTGIFGVFFIIIMEIAEKLRGFMQFLVPQLQDIGTLLNDIKLWIISSTEFLPDSIKTVLHDNVTLFFDSLIENGIGSLTEKINLDSLVSFGGNLISGTVAHIPSIFIACIISIVSSVFICSDFPRIKAFFLRQLSENNAKKMSDGWKLGISSLKKMLKAYAIIIFVTFSELSIGFYIMKALKIFNSPYIFLIAFIIALIDIIPVLGTGTVLIPWSVIVLLSGDIPLGIGLIIMYLIITVIRQIIEPKLVAGQVGLPPIVTIMAMYIGTKTLGALGFFILPFTVILIKVFNDAGLIHVFKEVIDEKTDEIINSEGKGRKKRKAAAASDTSKEMDKSNNVEASDENITDNSEGEQNTEEDKSQDNDVESSEEKPFNEESVLEKIDRQGED